MKDKIEQHVEQALQGKAAGRLQHILQSRLGLWMIAAISFFESALPVPLITDPFMVAGILANRKRVVQVVLVTIVSSILGGLAAFAMAAFFFDSIITHIMSESAQTEFQARATFGDSDALVTTLTGAVTPIPYTVIAWVVAAAGGSVVTFIVGSVIGRTFRYAVVGYCAYLFGPAALRYAKRSLAISSVIVLVLVGLYVWLKL